MSALSLPIFKRPLQPLPAILLLALVFGALDILDATLFWGIAMDVAPIHIFLGIASGLLGNAAFGGGAVTALLGALLEFLGFACLLGIFCLAAWKWPALRSQPWGAGLGYGLVSYAVIHYLLLPLSAYHIVPGFYPMVFVNALLAQTLFVGVPCAMLAGAMGSVASAADEEARPGAPQASTGG